MPRKPASQKTDTAKKTTRKKKAASEAVAETTPITAAEVVESVADTAVVDAPAVEVLPRSAAGSLRQRKPKLSLKKLRSSQSRPLKLSPEPLLLKRL